MLVIKSRKLTQIKIQTNAIKSGYSSEYESKNNVNTKIGSILGEVFMLYECSGVSWKNMRSQSLKVAP